jgi:anti-anti-sigma factor
MEPPEPSIEIREHRDADGTLVLSVSGRLDRSTAADFAERTADSVSRQWALVLDLNELDFMDAFGLRVLLAAAHRAHEAGCSVSLERPHGPMLRLYDQAGLEAVLPLRGDEPADPEPGSDGRGRFARHTRRAEHRG